MTEPEVTFPIVKGSSPKKAKKAKRKGPTPMVECDRLFGSIIRSRGFCESGRDVEHKGPLQCAHGFSRRYRATRWKEKQCWCLCAGCHMYFTQRPLEWDEWMRSRLGVFYEELRVLALTGRNPDLKETVVRLRERWAQIEGRAAA